MTALRQRLEAERGMRNFASTMVAPVITVFATVRYFVMYLVQYVRGLMGGLGIGAGAEPATIPDVPTEREGKREPAYPQYLFHQMWSDTRQVARLTWRNQRKSTVDVFAKKVKRRFTPELDEGAPNVPFGVAHAVAIGLAFAFAVVVLAAVAVVQAVAFFGMMVLCVAVIYLLRVIDTALLQIRGISITCPNPNDFSRVPYPSYKCPKCPTKHHDVRPGRYGVIKRRCRCGYTFPTLLMLGSHRLEAYCPTCSSPLSDSAGAEPEIILPVFGAGNAGKTRLMVLLAVAALERMEDNSTKRVQPDRDTQKWIDEQSQRMSISGAPEKTPPDIKRPFVLRFDYGRKNRRTLKIFDVAGEIFDNNSSRIDELRYVRAARTFVFVLDPLAIEQFWSSLSPEQRERLKDVRSLREPRSIFDNAVSAFEAMNVATDKARLVVAVTKADLITEELVQAGVDNDASICDWLSDEMGQVNMVTAMKQRFAGVEFVLTAAVRHTNEVDRSVRRFMDSVLFGEGMK